jgi:KDO2-lipid IV(A) lauroyltransferase
MRKLMRAGETVAVVIDQNVHLEDAVFVDFFGTKAATTPIASWFAWKTGAALVPAFSFPLPDGRYRAVYEEPIDAAPYRDLPRDEAILALTQKLADIQERYIRERPDCWLWMHRRWRTRPPAEPSRGGAPSSSSSSGGLAPERVEEAALP